MKIAHVLLLIMMLGILINKSLAQNRGILLSYNSLSTGNVIKDHWRIKLKTHKGHVYFGKFEILNEDYLVMRKSLLRKDTIDVSDIKLVKRHPLAFTIPVNTIFTVYGITLISTGMIFPIGVIAAGTELFFVPISLATGSGLIGAGSLLLTSVRNGINPLVGYSSIDGWSFQLSTGFD